MLPHCLAKVRSSSFGISGRNCKRKWDTNWFSNTRPILMHLAYLLTCCFNCRFLLTIFFVNIRWFYLNKFCELKQRFLHVFHGIDQTVIDSAIDEWRGRLRASVRAKGGHFEQLLWQYSAIWRVVSDFFKCNMILDFFLKLPQIRTSKFRKVAWQHTEGTVGSIICFVRNLVIFQQ